MGLIRGVLAGLPGDIPVDPDAPEARRWLLEELGKSEYEPSQATWFDDLVDWFSRLLDGIRIGGGDGQGALGLVVVLVLIAAILVVAFLVYGRPRLNRRSAGIGALFGEEDVRDAAAMRRDAERAAADGDHTTAIAELFRALARGLAERGIVDPAPGTTAREVAARAGLPFPAARDRLTEAALVFDGVRYLGRTGSPDQWQRMVALEREIRGSRPLIERPVPDGPPVAAP